MQRRLENLEQKKQQIKKGYSDKLIYNELKLTIPNTIDSYLSTNIQVI